MASPVIIEGESRGSIVLERLGERPFTNSELKDL